MATTELFDVPSFNAVQARIAMILGNGVGDKGYGQLLLSTQLNTVVTVQNYIDLRADILKARYHQKGNIAVPIPVITNTVSSTTWNAIKATITNVELDRLLTPPLTFGFSELLVSETSSSAWNSTTSHTITLQFDNADAMRHYFNTGSYVSFTASLTGGLTSGAGGAKKASWASLLLNIGELRFKYNATTSTKVAGTTKGFRDLTDTDQIFFSKSYISIPSNNVYTISARLSSDNEITFTVNFVNAGENVTGTLVSSIKSFHAGNADSNTNATMVNVPAPIAQSVFSAGTANPTFTPYRSTSVISETGTNTSVTISVTATNFSGPLFYKIKGTANGTVMSNITASDFIDIPLEGQITIDIDGTTTTPLVITANADNLTEGKETFDIEFRTVSDATAPVVTSIVGFFKSPIAILDNSLTIPNPVLTFKKLSVTSVTEGAIASFTVIGTNVPANSTVYWEINSLSGTAITPSDFKDGVVSGSFTMNSNTYTLAINVVNDNIVETIESFRVYAYMLDSSNNKISSSEAYSEMMQIIDAAVVVLDPPFIALPPSVNSILEGSTIGVTFNVTTPLWCTKLWYTVVTDFANGTNSVTTSDFRDNLIQGYISISSGKGSLTKYAALDNITEGIETFHVDFFTDEARSSNKFSTSGVNINENVKYTVTRSALTVLEGSPAGVTFTVSTPYTPNTPQTSVRWTVMGESGVLTESDFYDNLLTGTVPIVDNTAVITLRPRIDGITEGTEVFHLKIETTNGTFLANSPSVSILENVQYAISAQRTVTTEGQAGINFDITTPYLPLRSKLYWVTIPVTGTITPSDFTDNAMTGYFFINPTTITNRYTLTRSATDDGITEGNESFYISLRTSSNADSEVARSEVVTITENVRCRIYPSTQVLTEGQPAMTFRITTMMLPDNTRIYWKINPMKGNVIADDFIVNDGQSTGANRLNGYALTQGNVASFSLAARADSITEDDETFTVSIHLNSINDQAEDTSDILTIHDVSPFIITADVTTVKEAITQGDLPNANVVTFTVLTPWMTDGTLLYWTTQSIMGIGASDFADGKTQDTVKVYGNKCTISRQIADDHTTEGTNVFAIQIRRNSFTDPVVPNGTSPSITIIDNSLTPVVVDPTQFGGTVSIIEKYGKTSVVEGGSVTFVISTTGVATTDNLYWSTFALSSLTNDLSQTESNAVFHVSGSADPRHAEITVTTLTNNDTKGPAGKSFLFRVHYGNNAQATVISTIPMIILDPTPYSISSNPSTISEGSSTSITVTSPLANTTIPWAITTNSGTATTGNNITITGAASYNSSALTGTVAVDNAGFGSFTIAAVSNNTVEGTRSINLALTETSASTIVTINESVSYRLIPTSLQSPYSIGPNTDVQFTLTTPKLSSTQVTAGLYWTLVGNNLSSKFSATSGQITGLSTTTYSYTFTIHSLTSTVDTDVQIQISSGSSSGPQVTLTNSVNQIKLLNNISSAAYSVIITTVGGTQITNSNILEGTTFLFKVTTPKPNTTFTWKLQSVTDPGLVVSDFASGLANEVGFEKYDNISDANGIALIPFTFSSGMKHGNKTFRLLVQIAGATVNGGTSADIIRTEISAAGSSAYSITPFVDSTKLTLPYNVVEQSAITFKVSTPNIGSSNKTYTWWILANPPVDLFEYPATGGPFQINASTSSGEFTIGVPQAHPAGKTVPPEGRTFKIIITSDTNEVVISESTSPLIKIIDLSNSNYIITTPSTTVVEGESITFTVTRPAIINDKSVTWWLAPADSNSTFNNIPHVTLPNQTIDFSTGSVQTVTIKTNADTVTNSNRTFKMMLTGKTVPNSPVITIVDTAAFSVVDNLASFNKSINETSPNNVVIFTVTATGVTTPLYYRVNGNVASTDFTAPVITPINNMLTGQTSNVSNSTVTLQFIAAADETTNNPVKQFYVEFSKTSNFDNPIRSSVITINDTSNPQPSFSLGINIPTPPIIRLGDVVSVVFSATYTQAAIAKLSALNIYNPVPVLEFTFSYTAASNITRNIKITGDNTTTSSNTLKVMSGTRGFGNNPNAVGTSITLTTILDPTEPSGPIDVTVTAIDPLTKKLISRTQRFVYIQPPIKTISFTTASRWQVPANVSQVQVELYGGGGQGGKPSTVDNSSGYDGGSGDDVRGIISVTPGQSLYINFINGGAASKIDSTGRIGQGGQGGNGVILYNSASPDPGQIIAFAGGGGGGQGANATNNQTFGNTPHNISSFIAGIGLENAGVGSTTANGAGGAGAPGGLPVVQHNSGSTNGGISFIPSNFVCTPGGADNGQRGIKIGANQAINPISDSAHATITYAIDNVINIDDSLFNEWSKPGTYTVTVPTGYSSASVLIIGGGGGGAGGIARRNWVGSSGGGGGSGATFQFSMDVTPNTTINIVVGKGGTGGDAVVTQRSDTYPTGIAYFGVSDGGAGTDTTIAYNGNWIAGGGGQGQGGNAYFTNSMDTLIYGQTANNAGNPGRKNWPNAAHSVISGQTGGRGNFDTLGKNIPPGTQTAPGASGGQTGTLYGNGGASKSVTASSDPDIWTTVTGMPGQDGYVAIIWLK